MRFYIIHLMILYDCSVIFYGFISFSVICQRVFCSFSKDIKTNFNPVYYAPFIQWFCMPPHHLNILKTPYGVTPPAPHCWLAIRDPIHHEALAGFCFPFLWLLLLDVGRYWHICVGTLLVSCMFPFVFANICPIKCPQTTTQLYLKSIRISSGSLSIPETPEVAGTNTFS